MQCAQRNLRVTCVIRCLPWLFFQTAEKPGRDKEVDPDCVWGWPWASGGSKAAAEPTRFSDGSRSEASFLSFCCVGRLSWFDENRDLRGGAAIAETGWGAELSWFGICKGISWGLDTESGCSGFWPMPTRVMFRLVPVVAKGNTVSFDFALGRGTLEQVCKWVRRPRYDRNFVRQLSQLKQEKEHYMIQILQRKNRAWAERVKLTGRICWVCDDASCVPSVSACWGRNCCSQLLSTAGLFLKTGHNVPIVV